MNNQHQQQPGDARPDEILTNPPYAPRAHRRRMWNWTQQAGNTSAGDSKIDTRTHAHRQPLTAIPPCFRTPFIPRSPVPFPRPRPSAWTAVARSHASSAQGRAACVSVPVTRVPARSRICTREQQNAGRRNAVASVCIFWCMHARSLRRGRVPAHQNRCAVRALCTVEPACALQASRRG